MSSSVSVLAPNGRRQTVKCTANMTIMQIIEEVCRKQGYNSEEYDIKHHKKILDTTIPFRFSGLPNNAQLELVVASKTREDSDVILAVTFENGNRVVGNFHPDENLWQVLSNTCPGEIQSGSNPVVIYMRNEVFGDNLSKTTLRSLGLRGGRAMIRLVHKAPEDLKTQANISAPLPTKPVEEKPYHRSFKPVEECYTSAQTQKLAPVQHKVEQLAAEKRKHDTSSVSSSSISDSDIIQPKVKLKVENNKVEDIENAMDVDLTEPDTSFCSHLAPEPIEAENEENFVFLGERNAMLFSLNSADSVPAEDLPDDFFELTIDDARKILKDIKKKRKELENGVLMTSAMRNLEESKKQLRHLSRYKQSIIRIKFPDSSVLQGTFKPTESIQDVCDFIRKYLENTSLSFYLYTTPPKSILSEQLTLVESGCVPGALLHFGTDLINNHNSFLQPELKDKFTSNSIASLAASKMRKESTRPDASEVMEDDPDLAEATPGPSSQLTSYEQKVVTRTEKVPKWFKTGK